jgi:hypothetical protein
MSTTKVPSIVLYEDGVEHVLVSLRNNDRFVLTAQEAVKACRAWDKSVQFQVQFETLLERLSKWVTENRSRISAAQLNVRPNDILFVVTQSQVKRDDDLASRLTELDLEVSGGGVFDLISLNVLSLPLVDNESTTAFRSSGEILTHAE